MDIPLSSLRHFYEVSRLRSFTAAARALKVSQPGVSKSISQLELVVGSTLLLRGKKGVALTPAGEVLFRRCEAIFGELKTLHQELKSINQDCSGPLNIGASDNLCNHVLPALLKDFCKSHPRVEPRIFSGTAGDIQKELHGEKIELGFYYTPSQERGLVEKAVCFVENALIYPNIELPDQKKKSLFSNLKYIGSRRIDYRGQYPALQLLRSLGIEPQVGIETNSQEAQKNMVVAGLGYSVVPRFMVEAELKAGSLRILQTDKKIGNDLRLVKRKGETLSAQAEVFSQFFQAHILRYI